MQAFLRIVFFLGMGLHVLHLSNAQSSKLPSVLDPAWKIELVLSEPDIVTPICIRFDRHGRLFIVESHTHQRSDDYSGPANDRIRLLDDSDGDGKLNRVRTFYEAGKNTMGLIVDNDDWVYISSRSEIYRIRDNDNDGVADLREPILSFETSADYPHNGVGVMTFAPSGELVFGVGENFGASYRLVGSDGSTQVGSGEGGNIFACSRDGKNIRRIATGFWNPFGLTYDPAGRLWTVDNDPDASPPCRLIHVVETGDYGFQFRFGRSGTSPLQSWNGNLPGTLPGVGGTGEAPCAVLSYGNSLLVTSWGDNRIEAHQIHDDGGEWMGVFQTLVQGDSLFRPVDLVVAPDGSLFVSDWVDRSYPVHGKGRIWRLYRDDQSSAVSPTILDPKAPFPELTPWERRAAAHGKSTDSLAEQFLDSDLTEIDIQGVIAAAEARGVLLDAASVNSAERLAAAVQRRWKFICSEHQATEELEPFFRQLLGDSDPSVIQYAIRWIASLSDPRWVPLLKDTLNSTALDAPTVQLGFAAISYLELGSSDPRAQRAAFHELLANLIEDPNTRNDIRLVALNSLGPDSQRPTAESLVSIIRASRDGEIPKASLRLLAERTDESSLKAIRELALDDQLPPDLRADALASTRWSQEDIPRLQSITAGAKRADSIEAGRILAQLSGEVSGDGLPAVDDIQSWLKRVEGNGDTQAGFRVYMRSACAQCHAYQGRGSRLGPDLTGIGKTMSTARLLESILQPSKEVAPIYVPWKVITIDGRVHIGLKAISGGAASEARYVGTDGSVFSVPLAEIETQTASKESIMPAGLERTLSSEELRDLIAFLQSSTELPN